MWLLQSQVLHTDNPGKLRREIILPMILSQVISFNFYAIGGSSLLIVVGVALETTKQIESQMLMRHYKGFLE